MYNLLLFNFSFKKLKYNYKDTLIDIINNINTDLWNINYFHKFFLKYYFVFDLNKYFFVLNYEVHDFIQR